MPAGLQPAPHGYRPQAVGTGFTPWRPPPCWHYCATPEAEKERRCTAGAPESSRGAQRRRFSADCRSPHIVLHFLPYALRIIVDRLRSATKRPDTRPLKTSTPPHEPTPIQLKNYIISLWYLCNRVYNILHMQRFFKILARIGVITALVLIWYTLFSFSLFLGLQVSTALGNIGIIITLISPVAGFFIWRSIRKRKGAKSGPELNHQKNSD